VPAGTEKLTVTGVVKVVPEGPNSNTDVTAPLGAVIVEEAMVMVVSLARAPAGICSVGPLGSETEPPFAPIVPVPFVFPPPPPPASEPPHAVTRESAHASAATVLNPTPLVVTMTVGEYARTFRRIAAPQAGELKRAVCHVVKCDFNPR
jgi:hypothetical protein